MINNDDGYHLHLYRAEQKSLGPLVICHVNLSHGESHLIFVFVCLILFDKRNHQFSIKADTAIFICWQEEPTRDSKARPHLAGSLIISPKKSVPFKSYDVF